MVGGSDSFKLVHLALGVSDTSFGPFPLPLTFAGGCRLLVSAEVVVTTATDPSGFARTTVPVPNLPALIGAVFYGQWVQPQAGVLATSNAIAAFIGT